MEEHKRELIRNFSIIAHIDHGKSTIADRLLELTGTVSKREMQDQLLDGMDLERERGITIKAHPVTMRYAAKDGKVYTINFIDTPGHVDFSYEVSRSLAACEGALLIVDAGQGVQAQTLANVHLALDRNLEIIPVINKIDLPAADIEGTKSQIETLIGLDAKDAICCSAKTGQNIEAILERIVSVCPSPTTPKGIVDDGILRALIFDSHYDPYRGVMVYVRVMSGTLKAGDGVFFFASDKVFTVDCVGIFCPKEKVIPILRAGEVGFFLAGIKKPSDVKIGDTITHHKAPCQAPLPGFKTLKPVVFAGIYPVDASDFEGLRDALLRLQLNDSALHIEQESSQVLGFGFRLGLLGLLHLEITSERLRREYDLDIITTAPSVAFEFLMRDGQKKIVDNPAHYPDPSHIEEVFEPYVMCHILMPADYVGAVMSLAKDKRGTCTKTETVSGGRLLLTYEFPLAEIITDFSDRLKSITSGYASYDYEMADMRPTDVVKLEIRVNEEVVDAFSHLIHRSKAEAKGRAVCKKLSEEIPRQLFKVPIQAAIGGKIIARETISAMGKNVTAKCYGGDITRKRKLWEKQRKGKERMKEFGKVAIPHSAFMAVLKAEEE